MAPTGIVAFNIRGITIHSALSISINNSKNYIELTGERLKDYKKS